MKFRPRSFPHPVLGNGDDVPEAGFQVIFDTRHDKTNYYLDSHFQISSPTLLDLIHHKRAAYIMHVECGTTFFRQRYQYFSAENKESIYADFLRDAVEVNHFIIATEDITQYRPDGMHADYGEAFFNIRKGDILGIITPGQRFLVDKDFDSLQPVDSILIIVPSDEQTGTMKVDLLSPDKIQVFLSKDDYNNYMSLKSRPEMVPMIHSTIVLPALMEAINAIDTDGDAYDDCRWSLSLRNQLDAITDADKFKKAQKLLDLPVGRTMSALKTYTDSLA